MSPHLRFLVSKPFLYTSQGSACVSDQKFKLEIIWATMFSQMSQDDTVKDMMQNDSSKNANQTQYFSFKTFIKLKQYLCDKKKRVWQFTTIIQLALCHLVTSHFQEIACNYTPKGQIRWPIFLLLLCMIVLTEITSKFPKPIIFRILVFSCHKMTLITIITRMPLNSDQSKAY